MRKARPHLFFDSINYIDKARELKRTDPTYNPRLRPARRPPAQGPIFPPPLPPAGVEKRA